MIDPNKSAALDFLRKIDSYNSKIREIEEEASECEEQGYHELHEQRRKISNKISESLREASTNKKFSNNFWFRTVAWKYSPQPLSLEGNIQRGGRLNFGTALGDKNRFPPFPAIHLAETKEASELEFFKKDDLSRTIPTTTVSCSLLLKNYIDLRNTRTLSKFVKLIKGFSYSDPLKKKRRKIGYKHRNAVVTSLRLLNEVLLEEEWENYQISHKIPSGSQIFGSLVYRAGIEGIMYPSAKGNKLNLAVFVKNIKEGSFIQIHGTPPEGSGTIMKIDFGNKENIIKGL